MTPDFIKYFELRILRVICMLFVASCALPGSAGDTRTLMIINSFDDEEPWVDDLTRAIIFHAASTPGVDCSIADFDSSFAPDHETFDKLTDMVIGSVGDRTPSYVVMIGNLAFNMREAVRKAWGNVPILLVTRVRGVASLGDYLDDLNQLQPLGEYRLDSSPGEGYNFTAIVVPAMYEQTVEMMRGMLPEMKELVFVSDNVFYNRNTAAAISDYVQRRLPDVTFKWFDTSQDTIARGRQYFDDRSGHTGVLISSMGHRNAGSPLKITPDDIRLITYSKTPVFTLKTSAMSYGAVGGVFPKVSELNEKAIEVLDAMFAGENMRRIPIVTVDRCETLVNYPMLLKYGIDVASCPADTIFIDRPTSFVEKYFWPMALILMILVLVLAGIFGRIRARRRSSRTSKRNIDFLTNMPVPYAAIKVRLDKDGKMAKFEYKMKNEAYARIIEANRILSGPSRIFPAEFICPKVDRLLATGEPVTFKYHFPYSDTYYTFILRPAENSSLDPSPDAKLIDVFALDYTSLRHNEHELRMLARRLDVTLESARRDPFSFNISEGKVVYDSFIRVGDTDARQKVTCDFISRMELVHPDDRHLFTELIYDRRPGDGRKFSFDYRRKRPGSDDYDEWMEISGSIEEFNKYGRPERVIGSLHTITTRKQREQAMAEALERANESEVMKMSFLANISHEIRTPLNAIMGFSNVIAHTDDKEEQKKCCGIIERNTTQLLTLIDDVMDLAKIEGNMVELTFRDTDINALVQDVCERYAAGVPKGVTLSFVPGARICVDCVDSDRVRQVLSHMVGNACKFTRKGYVTVGYEILEDGALYFYVKDSGRGIPAEEIGKVFDRFYKGDPFVPGTGLGLPICKKLIEMMGGSIGVSSDGPGRGSTFWFTLPSGQTTEQ